MEFNPIKEVTTQTVYKSWKEGLKTERKGIIVNPDGSRDVIDVDEYDAWTKEHSEIPPECMITTYLNTKERQASHQKPVARKSLKPRKLIFKDKVLQQQKDYTALQQSFQERTTANSTFTFPHPHVVPEPHRAQMIYEITQQLHHTPTRDVYTIWKRMGKLTPCKKKCYYNDPELLVEGPEEAAEVTNFLLTVELPATESFHFSFPLSSTPPPPSSPDIHD